jgi:hypothetical protein
MSLILGIPPKSGIDWTNFPYQMIHNYLQSWLRSCCARESGIRVITTNKRSQLMPQDGLVYLVGDRSDSVIARLRAPESANLDSGQTSVKYGPDAGMVSEVYVNPSVVPYPIAANIYHELLHNKFREGQNGGSRVHATINGNFTHAGAPYDPGGPSASDQQLMSEALSTISPQCQAGFDLAG